MKSAFTVDEIIEACFLFDLEVGILEDDESEYPSCLLAQCGEIGFTILLMGDGPFYEGLTLSVIQSTDDNPFDIAQNWNLSFRWSTAVAMTEPDGAIATNSGGEYGVSLHRRVLFFGGISDDALEAEIGFFVYEMLLFFGLEDEVDDADNADLMPMNASRTRVAITEELTRKNPQTARELAASLGIHKSQVNSTLYSSPDLFTRIQSSPPTWTLTTSN